MAKKGHKKKYIDTGAIAYGVVFALMFATVLALICSGLIKQHRAAGTESQEIAEDFEEEETYAEIPSSAVETPLPEKAPKVIFPSAP